MNIDAGYTTINGDTAWRECSKCAPVQPVHSQATSEKVTVQEAARISGYSAHHLRRLLRTGKLEGSLKSQRWLLDLSSLKAYLYRAISANDLRFSPHKAWQPPF